MTEKRIKEISEEYFRGGWYGIEINAIKAIAAEARNGAIDEMREKCRLPNERNSWGFLQKMTIRWHNEILDKEAARLKKSPPN